MSELPHRSPLTEINRLIKENRVSDYVSPNLALGMRPLAFGTGTSQWLWDHQPPAALNPFGTIQGGYITVLIKGDVAAVTAAIEAGKAKVEGLGRLIAAHVIASPSEGVLRLLPK